MESGRILIGLNNDNSIGKLRSILVEGGYTVIDHAKDGNDCLRKMRVLRPDITILEYNLPLLNGYEVSRVAIEDKLCDIILIVTDDQRSYISDLEQACGFISMAKPLNRVALTCTIDLMLKDRKYIKGLEKEIEELKDTLEARKEIEKAKGLLMKHLNLSEEEAFKRIQRQSMNRGIPMKEVARAIILAYDV